jgi:hypothetical protein
MKRKIKLRAWIFERNKFLPIAQIHTDTDNATLRGITAAFAGNEYLASQINIQEYTGVNDNNGKEIYEGDIIRQLELERTGQVYYDSTGAMWRIVGDEDNESLGDWFHCEVIGNIHETPELLQPPQREMVPSPSRQVETLVRQCDQKYIDDWNKLHKVGEAVKLTKDDGSVVETETRSGAFLSSDGMGVIFLNGISGYYLLDRVASA